MKLSTEKIKEIALGAADVFEKDGYTEIYRFTKEQRDYYAQTNLEGKELSAAGIKFLFKTDAESLKIEAFCQKRTTRAYFSIDVLVNGEYLGSVCNFKEEQMVGNYSLLALQEGEVSGEFSLSAGEKEVEILLPWSAEIKIKSLSLDGASFIEPVKPEKLLLSYGDSITHGYDARRNFNRYAYKLSKALGASEICKAIGAEVFVPALARLKEDINPDYITVAYGTNDWSKKEFDIAQKNCCEFFKTISENYPNAKIFAITPIWRADMNEQRPFGEFKKAEQMICDVVKDIKNATVIRGFDLVPHDTSLFVEERLHPKDEGFEHYAKNLIAEIKKANL